MKSQLFHKLILGCQFEPIFVLSILLQQKTSKMIILESKSAHGTRSSLTFYMFSLNLPHSLFELFDYYLLLLVNII